MSLNGNSGYGNGASTSAIKDPCSLRGDGGEPLIWKALDPWHGAER